MKLNSANVPIQINLPDNAQQGNHLQNGYKSPDKKNSGNNNQFYSPIQQLNPNPDPKSFSPNSNNKSPLPVIM